MKNSTEIYREARIWFEDTMQSKETWDSHDMDMLIDRIMDLGLITAEDDIEAIRIELEIHVEFDLEYEFKEK